MTHQINGKSKDMRRADNIVDSYYSLSRCYNRSDSTNFELRRDLIIVTTALELLERVHHYATEDHTHIVDLFDELT